jgi:hypothetical protein
MAENNDFGERLNFAFKNSPKSGSGFMDLARPLLWAMGQPTGFGRAGIDMNEYFYNQAIRRGQNPMSIIPGMGGAGASSSSAAAARPGPKTDKLAPWYVDWLKSSGVRGLL